MNETQAQTEHIIDINKLAEKSNFYKGKSITFLPLVSVLSSKKSKKKIQKRFFLGI